MHECRRLASGQHRGDAQLVFRVAVAVGERIGQQSFADETLAVVFDRPLMTVQLALKTFEEFRMLHFQNGIAVISNWGKHQNSEALADIREKGRQRVAKYRAKRYIGVTTALQAALLSISLSISLSNSNSLLRCLWTRSRV